MKRFVIYVHGKGGTAGEAKHYEPLFPESDVIGFDYQSENPWDAKREFSDFYDRNSKGYDSVILAANSIGAFFSMCALSEKTISKALFISPIVNMENLITNMMMWSNVTETSVYKGYKQDKIEMRGDRAEMSDFPLYLNTVAGGLDRRDQTIGGFSFVVKIYAVPVVEIIG